MSAFRIVGCTAGLALLALSGCSTAPAAPRSDEQHTLLLEEAYGSIAKYYIEPVEPRALALAGLRALSNLDPSLGLVAEDDAVLLRRGEETLRFPAPAAGDVAGWARLTDRLTALARSRSLALGAVPPERLDQIELEAGVNLLDRFSHYAPPEQAQERRAARDGFGGIGVTLNSEGSDIRITEVLPETPAAAAGLHVNDRIVAIDGIEAGSLPREDVIHRLRGPADSVVQLAVMRPGLAGRLAFAVHRARIVPPTVTLAEAHGIAHLRVSSFNQHTGQSLAELLRRAHEELGPEMRGVILDLRGNPGGLLDQSIEVASLFLDGMPVTSTRGRVAESIQYYQAPHRAVERLPLVVLVNGGSASAAEIVAAALQDTGRAVVVGSASYGKGTVQNVQRMPNEGELTITWARLFSPAGYVLHEHGVVPTICTADLPDDRDGVATALARSTGTLAATLDRPRGALDETGWKELRALCPGQHEDHAVEVRTAEKLLGDSALYAKVLSLAPAAARKPIATAGVVR
jgi:carboxyl-terminal processing protease